MYDVRVQYPEPPEPPPEAPGHNANQYPEPPPPRSGAPPAPRPVGLYASPSQPPRGEHAPQFAKSPRVKLAPIEICSPLKKKLPSVVAASATSPLRPVDSPQKHHGGRPLKPIGHAPSPPSFGTLLQSGIAYTEKEEQLMKNHEKVHGVRTISMSPRGQGSRLGEEYKMDFKAAGPAPEPGLKEVVFHPGSLGLFYKVQSGCIISVSPHGQAGVAGVSIGWVITKVEGSIYSISLLNAHVNGSYNYTVTFERCPQQPVCLAPAEMPCETDHYDLWVTPPPSPPGQFPPLAPEEEPSFAPEEEEAISSADGDEPPTAPQEAGSSSASAGKGKAAGWLPPPEYPLDGTEEYDLWQSDQSLPSAEKESGSPPWPPLAPDEEPPLAPEEVPLGRDDPVLAPAER